MVCLKNMTVITHSTGKILRVVGHGGDYHITVPYPGGRSVWFPITETDPVRALKIGLQVSIS